jgi:hypothetical protein
MARGIYIIIYYAADFIINQHLIIYRIQLHVVSEPPLGHICSVLFEICLL